MTPDAEPSMFERNPAMTAEVSVAGWVGVAWLACALWLFLAVLDRDSAHTRAHLFASAITTAAIMGGLLWAVGYAFRGAIVRLHRRGPKRIAPALRIVVMSMFVLSFMAATGLFVFLTEKF